MSKRVPPLEIILRHNGTAELVDATDATIWSSDADEDFREDVTDEFVQEADIDDLLSFLNDKDILSNAECAMFESGKWDVTEESLDSDEDDTSVYDSDEFDQDEDPADF